MRPIAHHYQADYDVWVAEQQAKVTAAVKAVVDGSATRREAWSLADGSRSQKQISEQSGLDQGGTSRFFKQLRGLGAVEGDMPKRTIEV